MIDCESVCLCGLLLNNESQKTMRFESTIGTGKQSGANHESSVGKKVGVGVLWEAGRKKQGSIVFSLFGSTTAPTMTPVAPLLLKNWNRNEWDGLLNWGNQHWMPRVPRINNPPLNAHTHIGLNRSHDYTSVCGLLVLNHESLVLPCSYGLPDWQAAVYIGLTNRYISLLPPAIWCIL